MNIENQIKKLWHRLIVTVPLFFAALFATFGVLLYWLTMKCSTTAILFCLLLFSPIFIFLFFHFNKMDNYKLYTLYLPLLSLFFGFFLARKQYHDFYHLRQLLTAGKIAIKGKIYDIEKTKNIHFPYEVIVKATHYTLKEKEWIPCMATFKIVTQRYGILSVSDEIALSNIVIGDVEQRFEHVLMKEGCLAYLFIPHLQAVQLHRPRYSLLRFLYRKRCALYKTIKKTCSEKTFIFFKMLFLGKKERCNETTIITNSFKHWGMVHMTARSGMHMTLYILLCATMFQALPLPFVGKNILLLLVAIIYALFSYPSVSFMRAFATSVSLILCHCIARRSDFLHITLLIYITQLLINPIVLFFLDFQLSFLLTIGIGFFFKKYFYKSLI